MAKLKIDVTADASNALQGFQQVQNKVSETSKKLEKEGGSIEDMFKRIKIAAAGAFAGFSAQRIISQVVQIRGEFQQLEAAFTTLLGSAEKATGMVKDLQQLAATTPFDMRGVASGAKQLLAYGVAADDVVDTMRRLGDVAAGLSLPLTDLAWLYGTTLTQGRMFTMDLRQFQARGIPMAEELAKIFGVTKNEVAGLVTAGKVTSKEVTQAIANMTNEGSRFGGLMEMQSHTITGQISNIQDTIEMMFNDIGKQSEGVINDALSLTSTLVDHWKEVAKVVGTVIVSYGLYKGTLMATIALEKARANLNYNTQIAVLGKEINATKALLAAKEASKNADLAEMVAKKKLSQVQADEIAKKRELLELEQQKVAANDMSSGLDAQITALQALQPLKEAEVKTDLEEAVASGTITEAQAAEIQSKRELLASLTQEAEARVANLQAKAQEAAAGVEAANAAANEAREKKEAAEEALEAAQEQIEKAYEEGEAEEQSAAEKALNEAAEQAKAAAIEYAEAVIATETAVEEANTAAEAANTAQTELNTVMQGANTTATKAGTLATTAETAAIGRTTIAMRLHSITTQAATIAQGIFAAAVNGVKTAWKGLTVAMATNPIGLILTGLTVAISLFTSFAESEDEAAEATNRFGDSQDKATANVEGLYAVLNSAESTSKAYKDAEKELIEVAKEYGITIDDEKNKTDQLIESKEKLIGLIKEEAIERQRANDISSASESYQEEIKNVKEDIKNALSDELKDSQKNQLVNLITDEDIKNLQEKRRAMNEAMQESVEAYGNAFSSYSKEFIEEYNKTIDQIQAKIFTYSDELGLNKDAVIENMRAVKDNVKALAEARDTYESTIAATNKAAEAAQNTANRMDELTDSERESANQAANVRKTTDELKSSIRKLLESYAHNNITFTLTLDTASIPDWMKSQLGINGKGGNQEEAHRRAAYWAEQLDWVNKNHATGRKYGNKWYTANEIATRAAQYSLADSQIQTDTSNYKAEQEKNKKKNAAAAKKAQNAAQKAANEAAQRAERMKSEQERWDEETADQRQQAIFAQEEARIAAIENAGEKERAERELQHKKDLYQLQQQELSYKKANYQHNKTVFENSAKGNKNKFTGTVDSTALTADQQKEIDAQRAKLEAEWSQYQKEQQQAQMQALYDYYKEYGSFEQKRLALTEEYAEKIRNAQTEGERMSLEKERDQKLSSLSYEDISKGIDWKTLFSGIGNMSIEMMKQMQEQLKAFVKTPEYKNADSQTQQDVVELLQEMRKYLGTDQSVTWETLATALTNFNNSVTAYEKAQEDERTAIQNAIDAREAWQSGEISDEEYQKYVKAQEEAGAATAKAKDDMEAFGNELNNTTDEVKNYTSGLSTALEKASAWENIEGFGDIKSAVGGFDQLKGTLDSVLPQMGDGMAKTVGTGLSSALGTGLNAIGDGLSSFLSSGIGSIIGIVAQIPKLILQIASAIKNFVTGILDSITELISLRWIDDLVNSILQAVGNLINAIFDLPENLYKVLEAIVVQGVGGLLNTVVGRIGNILSFGALSSKGPADWFTNSNAKEVEDTINALTDENKVLEKSIDDLNDTIENTNGVGAIKASQQAIDLQKKANENYKKIAEAQAGYHGSHHSWNYYWGGFSNDEISSLNSQFAANGLDSNWNGDIWGLSPEQMKILRENADIWQRILSTGKGGYGESVGEKLDDYIDQAGKIEEITNQLYETLTTTTKDNVFDDFLNSLYDLADDSEDVFDDIADNWQEMVNKMVINNLVGAKFQKQLESWYESLAKLNERRTNGEITDAQYKAELDALYNQYRGYVQSAQNDINSFKQAGIINPVDSSSEQNASANGVSSITYDQANTFIGLVTAGNIVVQRISDNVEKGIVSLASITGFTSSTNTAVLEIRNLMIYNNSYLEDMVKYSKSIYNDFSTKIDQTNKYLKQMQ